MTDITPIGGWKLRQEAGTPRELAKCFNVFSPLMVTGQVPPSCMVPGIFFTSIGEHLRRYFLNT